MNILNEINQAGLSVTLAGDKLKVEGPLTDYFRSLIINNRAEIINQLSSPQLQQNIREQIEERAAIMEFDGGLSRKDAEQAASAAIRVYCYRMKDKPNSELTVIMPGTELDEALENLQNKYGDRLLDVYPSPYCMTRIIPLSAAKH